MSLEEQFDQASKHFEQIYTHTSDKQKLRFYALYNQAVSGDVDVKNPPPSYQVVKAAKFQARKKCIGLTKEMAMKRYISELRALDSEWAEGLNMGEEERFVASNPRHSKSKQAKKLMKKAGSTLFRNHHDNKSGGGAANKKKLLKQLEDDFERAAEFAKQSDIFQDGNNQTLLYSYYKQATVGPCNTASPGFIFRRRYANWRAWVNLFDMSKQEAMEKYIAHVKRFAPEFAVQEPDNERIPSMGDDDNEVEDSLDRIYEAELTETMLKQLLKETSDMGGFIYVITGASGFIGTHLIGELFSRNENSLVLAVCRNSSREKLWTKLEKKYGVEIANRVIPLVGDISQENFGIKSSLLQTILRKNEGFGVDHFFHLAASYDMNASAQINQKANVQGTRNAIDFAKALHETFGTIYHYTSSIVVAGNFNGIFMESYLNEGQEFKNAYAETKYEAEKLVRSMLKKESWYKIYRPGIVVGSSITGEAEKIDGPYYFFKPLQQLRKYVPSSVILPCVEGDTMPLVPVDYVVKAMDAIAHNEDESLNGKTFHLVDPNPQTFVEVLNLLAKAAHAPQFSHKPVTMVQSFIPQRIVNTLSQIPVIAQAPQFFGSNVFKIPPTVVDYVYFETDYDDSETRHALLGTGVKCPKFESYCWKIWDFYERHMDRSLDKPKALQREIKNKIVLVTGASDGIGFTLSKRLAKAGAQVLLVARNKEKLNKAKEEIESFGGNAVIYPADLSQEDSTNEMIARVLDDFGTVDYLINNAGRSIRRSVEYQTDRFHDFSRCIDLNYYGSLRLILGFLPSMRTKGSGHIINVSSIGVITNAPRFGAYVASKAALDAFTRCIASEIANDGITASTIMMPLVNTKMIVSKKKYDHMHLLTTEDASMLIERAIVTKERTIMTNQGKYVNMGYFIFPSFTESIMTRLYKLEPEEAPHGKANSPTAQGDKQQLQAVKNLMRGVYY